MKKAWAMIVVLVLAALSAYFDQSILRVLSLAGSGLTASIIQCVIFSVLAFFMIRWIAPQARYHGRLGFRGLVIWFGLVFCGLVSNLSVQWAKVRIFGHIYVSTDLTEESYARKNDIDTKVFGIELSDAQVQSVTVAKRIAITFLEALHEEIVCRLLLISVLLLFMRPSGAVLCSAIVFGLMHAISPLSRSESPYQILDPILPALVLGIFFGIIYLRGGLVASTMAHFMLNLIGTFRSDMTFIADFVVFGSAFMALIVLPPTLWFTRNRSRLSRKLTFSAT